MEFVTGICAVAFGSSVTATTSSLVSVFLFTKMYLPKRQMRPAKLMDGFNNFQKKLKIEVVLNKTSS